MTDVNDFAMLQLLIKEEGEDEKDDSLELQAAAGGAIIVIDKEKACRLHAEHWWDRYLSISSFNKKHCYIL